jgi:flagellin-like hook-associated protein FlgL
LKFVSTVGSAKTATRIRSGSFATDSDPVAVAVQSGNMAGIDQGLADMGQAFERVTNAQTQVGLELARLPEDRARLDTQDRAADARRSSAEDANLAASSSAATQADAAHRAALSALANLGRLSLMDYLK